jgi:mannitol/fructose-specific phosphotransferase system IIA component (Ntr-type)
MLKQKNVFAGVQADSKKELLNLLISSFRDDVSEKELQAIKKVVFQREKKLSTGVGKGLAIPHGKSEKIKMNHAALAVLDSPIAYKAFDGEPVSIVFLFTGPEKEPRSHAKILASIARLLNNELFRKKVTARQTSAELYLALQEYEKN